MGNIFSDLSHLSIRDAEYVLFSPSGHSMSSLLYHVLYHVSHCFLLVRGHPLGMEQRGSYI